jgi:hypothetical protein
VGRAKTWTCQRRSAGAKCGKVNPSRLRKCSSCGKLRPKRKRPEHMKALDESYEVYMALNGGDFCAICFRKPTTRKLDRDHDHHTGLPRGLLCHRCNRMLPAWITPEWLDNAAGYLRRSLKETELGNRKEETTTDPELL